MPEQTRRENARAETGVRPLAGTRLMLRAKGLAGGERVETRRSETAPQAVPGGESTGATADRPNRRVFSGIGSSTETTPMKRHPFVRAFAHAHGATLYRATGEREFRGAGRRQHETVVRDSGENAGVIRHRITVPLPHPVLPVSFALSRA